MEIAIIGTGYVGTVTGACFAEAGNRVICGDKDSKKVKALQAGRPLIYEPGLEELVQRNIERGRLFFTSSIADAVKKSELIFMTVGTPPLKTGEADLSFLQSAIREIGRSMSKYRIIVNKSTVPVGTQRAVTKWIREETRVPFDVVSNPEFLREGAAIQDFLNPERVVIGTTQAGVFERMKELYAPFVREEGRILRMDPVSAELTKYACNAFLATRISFMNELADLCERTGADVEHLRQGMGLDSRIGKSFLKAGIGYGGSCFPKDIRALLSTAASSGMELRIVRAAEEINESQKSHLMRAVHAQFGKRLAGKTFAIWGVAFKPNTDDVREAPALKLIELLLKAKAKVQAYDPVAARNARELISGPGIRYCQDAYTALQGADALIIATEWDEFRRPDLARMRKLLRKPFIFDGRNILRPDEVLRAGFHYTGIGRGAAASRSSGVALGADEALEPVGSDLSAAATMAA